MTYPDNPALPVEEHIAYKGLTVREEFAARAIQGILMHYGAANPASIAKQATQMADALIEELNRPER